MTTVTIESPGTGKVVQLSPQWTNAFMDELRRTARYQTPPTDPDTYVGIDAIVTVEQPLRPKQTFHLRGRAGLQNVRTRRIRTFYMGLFLLELLA